MKTLLIMGIILLCLVACEPEYIDSRQMHGVVKEVDQFNIDINGGIYDYDSDGVVIAQGGYNCILCQKL